MSRKNDFTPHAPLSDEAFASLAAEVIPHDEVVLPEEVQGLRAFGTENQYESIAAVLAEHLESMRNKYAATLKYDAQETLRPWSLRACRPPAAVRRALARV